MPEPVDPDPAVAAVCSGAVLAGRYRIERVIAGRGGTRVFLATDQRSGNPVAVTIPLRPDELLPDVVSAVMAEANVAFRIRSRHAVEGVEVGLLGDGLPFIVTEYLDGCDLRKVLATRAPLAIDDAVGFVIQAADAVAEAHALGLVHRNLRPSNLFLTWGLDRAPLVKVLDFGVSRRSRTAAYASPLATDPQALDAVARVDALGPLQYWSPEQLRASMQAGVTAGAQASAHADAHSHVDLPCDIWALGAILYELVTAQPAYQERTLPAQLTGVMTAAPLSMLSIRPAVPAELERVVSSCLQKNPADRPQNVVTLVKMLVPFAPPWAAAAVTRITGTPVAGGAPARDDKPTAAGPANWLRERLTRRTAQATCAAIFAGALMWTEKRAPERPLTAVTLSPPSPIAMPAPVTPSPPAAPAPPSSPAAPPVPPAVVPSASLGPISLAPPEASPRHRQRKRSRSAPVASSDHRDARGPRGTGDPRSDPLDGRF